MMDIFSVVPIDGIDHRRLTEIRNRISCGNYNHDDWLDLVLILDKLIQYRVSKNTGG